MPSPGFSVLFRGGFLHAAVASLSTIGNTKVLVGGFLLGVTPLLVVEADGGGAEDAPAFTCTT